MSYDTRVISTRRGECLALIASPQRDRILGQARLHELRAGLVAGEIDQQLVDAIARTSARIIVFRAVNDHHTARYGFDPRLTDNECEELGYLLVKSQMPAHRAFLEHNVLAIVHTDFGGRELDGLRAGTAQLIRELTVSVRSANVDAGMAIRYEIDQWILRNMSFYFGVGFDQVIGAILPDKVPLFEMRCAKIRQKLFEWRARTRKS